jgi:inosose dehydratase
MKRNYLLLLLALLLTSTCFSGERGLKPVKFRLGIASYAFRDKTLDDVILTAQKTNVKRLALKSMHLPLNSTDEQIAQVKKKIQNAGLEIYAGAVIYMNSEQDVSQAFAYAKKAGFEVIVGVPKPELLDFVEEKVKEYDIKIAIHIHGDRKNLYPDSKSVYDIIKGRDKRMGICVDVGHTIRLNIDPAEDIRKYGDRVLDVQIWDCSSATHRGKAVLAGTGVLNFKEILQALIDIDYTGTVAVEFWDDPKSPEFGTAQTIGYIQGMLDAFDYAETPNTLTKEEVEAGWQLLFDGKTEKGWRGINQKSFPESGWFVANGELAVNAVDGAESQNGGDIITVKTYGDFELQWQWRMLSRGGNSGVKYFVEEGLADNSKHGIGLEYQILDDANHPWMIEGKMKPGDYYTVGALYGLYKPANKKLKLLNEYNDCRIISKGKHVEHWLNGVKVLEFERGSDDFKERVSQSKFKNIKNFGQAKEGHILLQDHGSKVYFRNIKIRELR